MNSNAFSGNMSIHYPPNVPNMPHGNAMPNAPSHPQWAHPNIPQGFPVHPQHHLMTQAYDPYFFQAPLSPKSAQGMMPAQNNVHGQGMGYPGVQMHNFQPQWWQARDPHHLPMLHSLGNNSMNEHIPYQATNQNHQSHHPQHAGTGAQNQSSQGLKGLGIHYPTVQAHQGMDSIPNQHIHNNYKSQMIPSQHIGNRPQDANTQPQGMRSTNVSRQGHHQDLNIPAHNAGMQDQHPTAQTQDNHNQNLPAQQQPLDLLPNPQNENTTTIQDFQQGQLPPSLEFSEPSFQSTAQNQNPEQAVNQDLLLPDTGPSHLPGLDELDFGGDASNDNSNPNLQYDNFFDLDAEVYDALMKFGDGSTTGPEALNLDPPTMTTREGQMHTTNNQQNRGNDDGKTQGQVEVQQQNQEQGNQDLNFPSLGIYSAEDWLGDSEDGLF